MAVYADHTITVQIDGDDVTVQIGPEGYSASLSDIKSMALAQTKDFSFLMAQMGVRLDALGTNLADAGAVKQALEGGTYKW